jgi:hypothetical protein
VTEEEEQEGKQQQQQQQLLLAASLAFTVMMHPLAHQTDIQYEKRS